MEALAGMMRGLFSAAPPAPQPAEELEGQRKREDKNSLRSLARQVTGVS